MENNKTIDIFQNLITPSYVCYESKLEKNLQLLRDIKNKSGVKILLALKGFAFSPYMNLVNKYLDGCCASGLHEALYAKDFNAKEIHTYSTAYKQNDFTSIAKISNHIVFNSVSNYNLCKNKILKHNSIGFRINPEISTAKTTMYDPCSINSRLGITIQTLQDELSKNKSLLNNIEGFHFHALCEQGSDDLEKVINIFEKNFSQYFEHIKWVNFGGGHLITSDEYDVDKLISIIQNFHKKYSHIQVYIEPGEAIGWQTGVLVASVLDIVTNNKQIAILDVSAEAHMPDTLLMPYKADVTFASKNINDKAFVYELTGNTCLAGDIMGDYSFDRKLEIGDKIIFEDMIHYTIVKNTTFNGVQLPSLAIITKNNELIVKKEFSYNEYKNRN
jgi:carboxynorspermidine decarboxylase